MDRHDESCPGASSLADERPRTRARQSNVASLNLRRSSTRGLQALRAAVAAHRKGRAHRSGRLVPHRRAHPCPSAPEQRGLAQLEEVQYARTASSPSSSRGSSQGPCAPIRAHRSGRSVTHRRAPDSSPSSSPASRTSSTARALQSRRAVAMARRTTTPAWGYRHPKLQGRLRD